MASPCKERHGRSSSRYEHWSKRRNRSGSSDQESSGRSSSSRSRHQGSRSSSPSRRRAARSNSRERHRNKWRERSGSPGSPGKRKNRARSSSQESTGKKKNRARSSSPESTERKKNRARSSSQESTGQKKNRARSSSQESTGQKKNRARSSSQESTGQKKNRARSSSQESTGQKKNRARSSSQESFGKKKNRARSSSQESIGKKKNLARSSSQESIGKNKNRARSSSSERTRKMKNRARSSSSERTRKIKNRARSSSPESPGKKRIRSRSSSPKRTGKQRHRSRSSSQERTRKMKNRARSSSHESNGRKKNRARSRSPESTGRMRIRSRSSSQKRTERQRHRSRSNSQERTRKKKNRTRSSSPERPRKMKNRARSSSHESNGRKKNRARSSSPKRTGRQRHRSRSNSQERTRKNKNRARSSSQESTGKSKNRARSSSQESTGGQRHRSRSRSQQRTRKKKIRSRSSSQKGTQRKRNGSRSSSQENGRRSRPQSQNGKMLSRSQSPEEEATALHGHLIEEKKKNKEILKAIETPEEKRARRLAKKEAKERKKREKMGWGDEYMGYTNADNPFGDNNLLGTFIWSKGMDKKGIGHLTEKDLKERNKRIQEDNRLELQKVKQLRLEREREKAMREQELEMLQREKEAEHFKTWEEQEDNFHLQQAKLRSKIRIRDGRAKPIDLLAKYISAEDDDLAVEMHEPYTFLTGLTASDLEDLLEDIRIYMELEQGKNVDFWRDMTVITEDEISKLQKLESFGKDPGKRREGVNASVSTDVQAVFKGKTYSQLHVMSQGIESKIRTGGPNLDIGYWESLLQQLRAYMARARLRERHQDILRQKLFKLKQEQGVESEPLFPILKQEADSLSERTFKEEPESEPPAQPPVPSTGEESESAMEGEEKPDGGESVLVEEDLIQQSLNDYDAGRYSPVLLTNQELPFDAHIVDFEEDQQRLVLCRQQLQVTGDACESPEDIFIRKAKEGMDGDEAQFSVEIPVTNKAYLWADKYRPRKPRFFNRVHTGFEWNKYNQTHYDFDNPPPKIVQGYKFNIFYPDLIDKRSTPEYFLEACQDNKDFAVLRFHAGPPYEDIAFKIVNREWEYSHRHGFRCQFSNGIFQLWFHFKRYRYRR